MEKRIIKLSKGQYLSDIEPFKTKGIPTNSIVHKVLTGCGATTLEIKYTNRNSIIIMPNVPVIEEKVKEHNDKHPKEQHVLGVHQKIDVGHIEDYLNSEATYKKIITTPEGFLYKVLPTFTGDLDRLYKEYFLLFDECERIVTDVSYRGDIAAPISWFFNFEQKALVSATTLSFSHIGFNAFSHYVIEPDFDYKKPINIINTNNIVESIAAVIEGLQGPHTFLFLNSTEAIHDVIEGVKINLETEVYCADKSVAKLVSKKFKAAYSKLNTKDLAKYNFLTSRYFSAYDIKLDYKPDVILITDVLTAEHSVLDPHTEIIQIAGRFRNGINSLTHITNFKPDLESKSKEEAMQYLKGCFYTYENVVDLFSKSLDQGSKDTLEFFVKHSPIAKYYIDNKLNEFMVDNYIYQHRVQGYYQRFENLKAAYDELDLHFEPMYTHVEYLISDEDRLNRKKSTVKAQQWETLKQIDKLSYKYKPGVITLRVANSDSLLTSLRGLYPWLTEAYDLLGLDGIEKTGLAAYKINPAKNKAKELRDLKRIRNEVYKRFDCVSEPEDEYIKSTMTELCSLTGLTIKASISLILKFYNGKRTTRNGRHIHALASKIDLDTLTPFD